MLKKLTRYSTKLHTVRLKLKIAKGATPAANMHIPNIHDTAITPGETKKLPLLLPVAMGLLSSSGEPLKLRLQVPSVLANKPIRDLIGDLIAGSSVEQSTN